MNESRVLAGFAIGLVLLAAGMGATAIAQDEASQSDTIGTDVSAFMQTGAADAADTVEDGMFDAAYENASEEERAELVEEHSDRLADRYEEIEAEYEALSEEDADDPAREARLSALATQMANLEQAINTTEERAAETGVDQTGLAELRANASDLSGPEIAEIAQGLAGVDVPPGPTGDNGGPDAGPPVGEEAD